MRAHEGRGKRQTNNGLVHASPQPLSGCSCYGACHRLHTSRIRPAHVPLEGGSEGNHVARGRLVRELHPHHTLLAGHALACACGCMVVASCMCQLVGQVVLWLCRPNPYSSFTSSTEYHSPLANKTSTNTELLNPRPAAPKQESALTLAAPLAQLLVAVHRSADDVHGPGNRRLVPFQDKHPAGPAVALVGLGALGVAYEASEGSGVGEEPSAVKERLLKCVEAASLGTRGTGDLHCM